MTYKVFVLNNTNELVYISRSYLDLALAQDDFWYKRKLFQGYAGHKFKLEIFGRVLPFKRPNELAKASAC